MTAEAVMRTVGVLACATSLSLLSTIFAYATANVANLRWDGSFCAARECASTVTLFDPARVQRTRIAALPSRA